MRKSETKSKNGKGTATLAIPECSKCRRKQAFASISYFYVQIVNPKPYYLHASSLTLQEEKR